ncbi:hypothetical protein SCHPADRAFT_900448 [Schizopora paradoxa]|uniref:PB1 domain-containing protein n=1 Tax=Schizopora paradoxa TaxID=27342 RepID=A0A0H2S117_9AGAM|nr:hypothetical protein SCHPADRAFT_900448 [Schizopora paradoxa]
MSLKAELETWAAALKAYDEEDFEKALDLFSRIADQSKILTNMGLIYATLGEHEAAVEHFTAATQLDQYLAVAYFQSGVSNFLLGRFDAALVNFEDAMAYLRMNQNINYEQLGLKFKLYSAEVLFNRGLSLIYMGRVDEGLELLEDGRRQKATDEHNVIDDAIRDRGEGYTVFSIPVGVLYRPSETKLKNTKTKDYMGKAKLVAAADAADAYTEFTGVARYRKGQTPSGAPLERPPSDPTPALGRSQTVPAPREQVNDLDPPRAAALARSKTVLNVAGDARERTNPAPGSEAGGMSSSPAGLGRSMTMGARTPNAMGGQMGVTRGLSIRKNSAPGLTSPTQQPPPPPEKPVSSVGGGAPRLTEIYDGYMGGFADDEVPAVPPTQGRVAAWARTNANPGNIPSRSPSTRAPSAYASSAVGSVRRRPTRRGTVNRAPSRARTSFEEEEEGYVSGEYDDGPFELAKIRVKVHYQEDVRGMTLTPDVPFEEFMERITQKFNKSLNGLGMKFKDEDGGKVSLRDESDYELAIETARELAKGKAEGKLEIWCTDA